jgi:hypothetical protein
MRGTIGHSQVLQFSLRYYRGLADNAAGMPLRFIPLVADSYAKEAHRAVSSFRSLNMSPNLPADVGQSILERPKAHSILCTERKNEGQRENDLVYNTHPSLSRCTSSHQ